MYLVLREDEKFFRPFFMEDVREVEKLMRLEGTRVYDISKLPEVIKIVATFSVEVKDDE